MFQQCLQLFQRDEQTRVPALQADRPLSLSLARPLWSEAGERNARSLDAHDLFLTFSLSELEREEELIQSNTHSVHWKGEQGEGARCREETVSSPTTITRPNKQQPLPRFPDLHETPSATEGGGTGVKAEQGASAAFAPPPPQVPGADAPGVGGDGNAAVVVSVVGGRNCDGGGGGGVNGGGKNNLHKVVQEHAAEVASRTKERLMALKMLFDDGIISEADFSAQKSAILASI